MTQTTAATEAAPDTGPGFARRAEGLHRRGQTGAARRVLTAGARLHPGDPVARLVLAAICRDEGRDAEAREWLEAALRADPECPAALWQLSEMSEAGDPWRDTLAAQEPWDEGFRAAADPAPAEAKSSEDPAGAGPWAEPRAARAEPPRTFSFPVREEEEEPEIEEISAPHVATVTLAEIYFQQGLKEQAAQIYRQLLERQPGDAAVRKRLEEIEGN